MNVSFYNNSLNQLSFRTRFLKYSSLNIIFDLSGVIFSPHIEGHSSQTAMAISLKPNNLSSILQLLKTCKEAGHRLFILSNLKVQSYEFLKTDPHNSYLFSFFDDVILSDQVGYKKPDPRIFMHLVKKYELDPSACIFIDDEYHNLEAAEQVGIKETILCKNGDICQVRNDLQSYGIL